MRFLLKWINKEHLHTVKQRTGIMSRLEHRKALATHFLKSRGQTSSACLEHRKAQQPLTSWRAGTVIISRLETQQGTAATYILESREQASSAGLKYSKAQQPLTNWRAEDRHHQKPETQQGAAATHILESRGQVTSAGLKDSKAKQPPTTWRAENRHHQQVWNTARHCSHSLSGEQRTVIISRLETQQGTATTHFLESRSSAGLEHNKVQKSLTSWRAEDRHHQLAWNTARHSSHSPTGEQRTGIISWLEHRKAQQPLTFWRAEDRHHQQAWNSNAHQSLTSWRAEDRHYQQAWNTVRHSSHSQPGEQRTVIISRFETQQGTTHFLESRGQVSSAGLKHSKAQQPLTTWRAEDSHHQQAWNTARIAATHFLESRGQSLSAGLKHSMALQPLTNWRAEDSHHQQAWNTAKHSSHSPTGEHRTASISRLETQQGTAATHILESRAQPSSACLEHSKAQQPLTNWRAEDR